MADWYRVTRRFPCPICGGTSWCSISANDQVCLCMRVDSDWPARSGMGGHIHRLSGEALPPHTKKAAPSREGLSAQKRAEIGEWLLTQLSLETHHLKHLKGRQRQLSDEQIERRYYRSWPEARVRAIIASRALREFGSDMEQFPGLYKGRLGRSMFSGPEGLLLPVMGADGRVAGFQIKPDDPAIGRRIWLSSQGRHGGTGSRAPAHFSFPAHVQDPLIAYVVEGVLSADISSDLIGALVIGIAGKANWQTIEPRSLRRLFIATVVIALDEDIDPDEDNRQGMGKFLSRDFDVQSARWNRLAAKGFDDLLLVPGQFKIIEGT